MPEAVLRLRRIGLTATLTMRVTQWLPLVGWCHVTTGLATVRTTGETTLLTAGAATTPWE